jgi:hypothetical protein
MPIACQRLSEFEGVCHSSNMAPLATPLLDLQASKLRPLLKLNDELRALLSNEKDINVTTIVAVGDQSHGKTSVIEALSGIDLPRGEGIQTRVPLELRLRRVAQSSDERATLQVTGRIHICLCAF